jgi:hypothetical protein
MKFSLLDSDSNIVVISKAQTLERLAEIDAMLDIMESNDEDSLRAERGDLAWLLGDR